MMTNRQWMAFDPKKLVQSSESKFDTEATATKRLRISQIRRHEKRTYYNPRTYLIQNTKKVISTSSPHPRHSITTRKSDRSCKIPPASEKSDSIKLGDQKILRITAASHFRSKVQRSFQMSTVQPHITLNSSDVALLGSNPEEQCLFKQSRNKSQKKTRYFNNIQVGRSEIAQVRRIRIKNLWQAYETKKSNQNSFLRSLDNPHHDTSGEQNIKFEHKERSPLHSSRILINRQMRKELKKINSSNFTKRNEGRPMITKYEYTETIDHEELISPW